MTHTQYIRPIAALTGATALGLTLFALQPGSAAADDCLLDTNNDGNADTNVDTDGGANSAGNNDRLACGHGALATGAEAIANGVGKAQSGGRRCSL